MHRNISPKLHLENKTRKISPKRTMCGYNINPLYTLKNQGFSIAHMTLVTLIKIVMMTLTQPLKAVSTEDLFLRNIRHPQQFLQVGLLGWVRWPTKTNTLHAQCKKHVTIIAHNIQKAARTTKTYVFIFIFLPKNPSPHRKNKKTKSILLLFRLFLIYASIIMKKVTTIRRHLGFFLSFLRDVRGGVRIVLAPAEPTERRTIRGGSRATPAGSVWKDSIFWDELVNTIGMIKKFWWEIHYFGFLDDNPT